MATSDPYRSFNFRVEIDGISLSGFSEVSLGTVTTDVIEYRDGSSAAGAHKLPGQTRYSNIVLKRGITNSLELYQWHRMIVEGNVASARRNVAIVLSDETHADVARFNVRNAWPTKYEAPSFNASGSDIAIETLELAHEGFERTT